MCSMKKMLYFCCRGILIMCLICHSVFLGSAFAEENSMFDSIYSFTVRTIDGETRVLDYYRGKVILIVNTASRCGFTGQYRDLQAIYERYKDQGFEVLGFPCNDFMFQEPGTNEDIKEFCSLKFNVTFDLFEKIHVRGGNMHPLYEYLQKHEQFGGKITWNFNKFLVDRNGKVVDRFDTRDNPQSEKVLDVIEKVLKTQ